MKMQDKGFSHIEGLNDKAGADDKSAPALYDIDDFDRSVINRNFHYVLPGYSLFLISDFHKNMH